MVYNSKKLNKNNNINNFYYICKKTREITMATTKFKLGEVLELNTELLHLLQENITFKTKYWLNKILVETSKEVKTFDIIKAELIEKYGKEVKKGEGKSIDPSNKNWKDAQEEFNPVLENEIEINHTEFKFEDFNFTSPKNYYQFTKLFSE